MNKYIIFAISILALVYLKVVGFDYIWDDTILFEDLKLHKNSDIFHHTFTNPFFISYNYYRPLATLSLVWPASFIYEPWFNHTLTYLIFLFNCFILYQIIVRLPVWKNSKYNEYKKQISALAILFYGLHPSVIESAAWVSTRFDLLLSTFLLLAFLSELLLASKPKFRFFLVTLCYLCAALSKEMAIAYPIVFPVLYFITFKKEYTGVNFFKSFIISYAAIILGGILYLLIRFKGLGYIYVDNSVGSSPSISFLDRVELISDTIMLYLNLLIFPFTKISPVYPIDLNSNQFAISSYIGLLVITLAVLLISKIKLRKYVLLFFIWILLLSPVLNILHLNLSGALGSNRFITFPLSMILISVIILFHEQLSNRIFVSIFSLIFLINIFSTVTTLPLWSNNKSLWVWVVESQPQYEAAYVNAAGAFRKEGLNDLARNYLADGEPYYDEYLALKKLIEANLLAENDLEAAKSLLLSALEEKNVMQFYPKILLNLALFNINTKTYDDVEEMLKSALVFEPNSLMVHFYLIVYYSMTESVKMNAHIARFHELVEKSEIPKYKVLAEQYDVWDFINKYNSSLK